MRSVMVMNIMLLTSETETMWPGASADGCGWGWCCWWQHSWGQVFSLGSAQGSWAGAVWIGWGWFCWSGSRHGFTGVMTLPEMCFFSDGSRLDEISSTQKEAAVEVGRRTQLSGSHSRAGCKVHHGRWCGKSITVQITPARSLSSS